MPVDLRALYSVPPAEFVVARKALVGALKAEQRKAEAAAVQQLRRPRLAEHGLNLVARSQPVLVARWAAAVTDMDVAQSHAIGGGGAAQLREVTGTLRGAHAAVLQAAVHELGESGAAQRADINDTLRSLAHPEGVPLLTAGIVGSEQLGELALFAGAPEPVVQRDRVLSPEPTPKRREQAAGQQGAAEKSPTPRVDVRELRKLERQAAAALAESEHAELALAAARAALTEAKTAVAAATDRAANARKTARGVDTALTELRGPGPDDLATD